MEKQDRGVTLDAIRAERVELEGNIKALLQSFMRSTGCDVFSINTAVVDVTPIGRMVRHWDYQVHVTVRLPSSVGV